MVSIRGILQWARFGIKAAKMVLDKGDEVVDELQKELKEHGPKENSEG